MAYGQRNYRFKGIDPGKEQKHFWILAIVALAIGAALVYFF
jgi:paraquat-inducible protein B